jgi:hypothetical protein
MMDIGWANHLLTKMTLGLTDSLLTMIAIGRANRLLTKMALGLMNSLLTMMGIGWRTIF